ncbi:DUF4160 domain-containing protein [Botryobacter ruber]|uniref:DUF4160 domain-containing protein n=1 Tax=Botryobacter ruber TaxID=2171629 RepID=UPI000E0A00E1|nr:DUF4160 domain-containing protein [Botryobacter ruber]
MPELSRFYGIIIYMFTKDHNPPHFHAKYGEFIGVVNIKTGELIEGELPRRALRLVQDWTELHKEELILNWDSAQSENPEFKRIEPLS